MPIYRITILDEKNWKEIRENIEMNLREQAKVNEKIKNSRFIRPLLALYEKTFGIPFDISMSWEWKSDKVLIHSVFSTAMLKDEVYDNAEKKFLDCGKLKIEKLDKDGNVIKVLNDG